MIGEPMYYLEFGTGIATILMSFLMATLEQRSNMSEAYSEPCQHLRWNVLQKYLTAESLLRKKLRAEDRQLFLQKSPS